MMLEVVESCVYTRTSLCTLIGCAPGGSMLFNASRYMACRSRLLSSTACRTTWYVQTGIGKVMIEPA
jgi:hypothetical protein